jgi:hypothetical protein
MESISIFLGFKNVVDSVSYNKIERNFIGGIRHDKKMGVSV